MGITELGIEKNYKFPSVNEDSWFLQPGYIFLISYSG